jgi:hypothetical protein
MTWQIVTGRLVGRLRCGEGVFRARCPAQARASRLDCSSARMPGESLNLKSLHRGGGSLPHPAKGVRNHGSGVTLVFELDGAPA